MTKEKGPFDYLFGIFKLLFVLLSFFFCHCIVCPTIEKLEDTKEVIRSVNRRRTDNTMTKCKG
jgi:hypothetical protein